MTDPDDAALSWQTGVWDRMSKLYRREIESRFAPVVDAVMRRAALRPGERVLDLGTGTGAVAAHASAAVGERGSVVAVDLSAAMLAEAEERLASAGVSNVTLVEGRAESIPAEDRAFDVVLSSLCLMFAIDREQAAREIERVLRPGGRLVAAVWGSAEQCDIVRFQQTAGRFAGPPPIAGVGPGALAEPSAFLAALERAGVAARVEDEDLGFEFPDFDAAWDTLAGVTTIGLSAERRREAKDAVRAAMHAGAGPLRFRNLVRFLIGRTAR